MSHRPLRVVFMGSPEFSIPCLKAIAQDPDFEVAAVYSMPDKPKGRGKTLSPTPIKETAIKYGYEVRTPSSFKKEPEEIEVLKSYKPDFLVVVAYGLILPQAVLDIPTIAPINLHASLLPKYRGAAPMQYALLNGDKETGNTVMLMSKGMDEGDILAAEKLPIKEDDDLESIHDALSAMGAPLLTKTLKAFADGIIKPVPQEHEKATYTSKVDSETARIDWQKPAESIRNQIHAMSPFPGAWFNDEKERIKVFRAHVNHTKSSLPYGQVLKQDEEGISVVCGDSEILVMTELQRAGKNRMKVSDFLRGHKLSTVSLISKLDGETK